MNKTQKQFIRLGDFIIKKFAPEYSRAFEIHKEYFFRRDTDRYTFRYYNIVIVVSGKRFEVKLPDYIDITDFNKSKLLKDMWNDLLIFNKKADLVKDALTPFINGLQIFNKVLVAFNKELNNSNKSNESETNGEKKS